MKTKTQPRMTRKQEGPWSDVVDEMCCCGHRKSKHENEHFGPIVRKGSGACAEPGCSCARYTWKAFIYRHAAPAAGSCETQCEVVCEIGCEVHVETGRLPKKTERRSP